MKMFYEKDTDVNLIKEIKKDLIKILNEKCLKNIKEAI